MTKTVEVYVVQNYWKSATIEVEVPSHLEGDKLHDFIEAKETKDNHLSDELASASLQSEGGIEIEVNI